RRGPTSCHSIRARALRASPFRALHRSSRADRALAGGGAGAFHIRRGARPRRRLRPKLVARSRLPPPPADAAAHLPKAGNRLMAPEPTTKGSGSAAPVRVGVVGLGYWGPNLVLFFKQKTAYEIAYLC